MSVCIEPFQTPRVESFDEKESWILQLGAHLHTFEANRGHPMVLGQDLVKRLKNGSNMSD